MWEHSSRFISLTGIFALWAILQKMKVLPGITNGSLPGHIAVLEMNTYITHKKEVVDKKSKSLIAIPQAVKSLPKHQNIPGTLIQKMNFFSSSTLKYKVLYYKIKNYQH
jgi:hypothetical protein